MRGREMRGGDGGLRAEGWGAEEPRRKGRGRRRRRGGAGAGRCRYKARAGGSAAPFIAHGMAGGGGAERVRAGGLLPPACRQPRRRVSSGTGPGRGGGSGRTEPGETGGRGGFSRPR